MLADDLKRLVNEEFTKSKIPIKIHHIELFRPAFNQPPFEHLETINKPKQFAACNAVHMIVTMNYAKYIFEAELRYIDNNGKFTNEWCHLLTWDIFPGEDPLKINATLSEMAKITGIVVLATISEML